MRWTFSIWNISQSWCSGAKITITLVWHHKTASHSHPEVYFILFLHTLFCVSIKCTTRTRNLSDRFYRPTATRSTIIKVNQNNRIKSDLVWEKEPLHDSKHIAINEENNTKEHKQTQNSVVYSRDISSQTELSLINFILLLITSLTIIMKDFIKMWSFLSGPVIKRVNNGN